MDDNSLIKNKIFSYMLKKAKRLRKSFQKSKEKISSDDILNYSRPRNLSNSSIELESVSSTTSSSKTYVKSNSSNYSKRDNSLDLVRDDNSNHEIVLPYQRFSYIENRKLNKSKKLQPNNDIDLLRIEDDNNLVLDNVISYNNVSNK